MNENKGTVYDKLVSEDFYKTPDMGDYMNNYIYLQNQKGIVDEIDSAESTAYFVENPAATESRYYPDLEVIAVKVDVEKLRKNYLDDHNTIHNVYDGDTLYLDLDCIIDDTMESFKMYYDNDTIFTGVKHYIKESLGLTFDSQPFGVRFVGLNTPEIVHYSAVTAETIDGDYKDKKDAYAADDVFWCDYSMIKDNNEQVYLESRKGRHTSVSKSNLVYRSYTGKGEYTGGTGEISLQENDSYNRIYFLKMKSDSNKEYYYQIVEPVVTEENATSAQKEDGVYSTSTRTVRKIITNAEGNELPLSAYEQAEYAQKVVREAFANAKECVLYLDTMGLNGVRSELPLEYRKAYEYSSSSPLAVIGSMWSSIAGEKPSYRYAGYRAPGQEANGRFLGAIYLKTVNNGVAQWINLNKKVIYECNGTGAKGDMECHIEIRPRYSESLQSAVNDNYLAKGFKIWTYTDYTKLYVDGASNQLFSLMDDREEIQQRITGLKLEQLGEYTVMLGDTLLMVPPTSIRSVTQTKTMKTHLIRSRGYAAKQLPKTERILELDLYFNGDEGINGIPMIQELPNGEEITYYMNGLRGLIAQFKLCPFLPVHNNYINNVLNVDAVALANITVETMQDYPRTLHVRISMYEFNWRQFMPEQSAHDLASEEGLYVNGFSKTIMFPLLRYHYQRALIKGNELKAGQYNEVNTLEYIEQTIGSKTALQPMSFVEPRIDFYVPDSKLLSAKKQNKINMQNRPLGQTYTFTDLEKEFMASAYYLNNVFSLVKSEMKQVIDYANNTKSFELRLTTGYKSEYHITKDSWKEISHVTLEKDKEHMEVLHDSEGNVVEYRNRILERIAEVTEKVKAVYDENRAHVSNIISGFTIHLTIERTGVYGAKVGIAIEANLLERFRDTTNSMPNVVAFCSKNCQIKSSDIFKDGKIRLTYHNSFTSSKLTPIMQTYYYDSSSKFDLSEDGTHKALSFLSKLVDSAYSSGLDDFNVTDAIESLKEYTDVESAESMSFNLVDFGPNAPIVTSIVSSYNNIFANTSLKAIDGHAAQFTGGSDNSIVVNMIGNEEVVSSLNWISRACIDYLINYRKVMLCSPLRIDCEFARFLGIHEVIIESIDVNTIPNQPGLFNISLTLNSVDRTLRNRENLSKIKDIDNASADYESVINTKNYFDLKAVLSKAELYPDLELPTIEELEMAGFYFLKSNYNVTGHYADPDFYYVYLYPTLANNIRTNLTEYFKDPENLRYLAQGDLFAESAVATLGIRKAYNGNEIFTIKDSDYNGSLDTIEGHKEKIDYLVESGLLESSDRKRYEKAVEEMSQTGKLLSYLDESISDATYSTAVVNSITNITVSSNDYLYSSEEQESDESKEVEEVTIETGIKEEYYKTSIKKMNDDVIESLSKSLEQDIYIQTSLVAPDSFDDKGRFFIPESFSGRETNASTSQNYLKNALYKAITGHYVTQQSSMGQGLGKSLDKNGTDNNYCDMIIKAGAVGKMASKTVSSVSNSEIKCDVSGDNSPSCYPKMFETYVNKKGEEVRAELIYYIDSTTNEYQNVISKDEDSKLYSEQIASGVQFGSFGIKKYTKEELTEMLGTLILEDGFLEPYVNNDVRKFLNMETLDESALRSNLDKYIAGISRNLEYAFSAYQRQVSLWMIMLCKKEALISEAVFCAAKLVQLKNETGDHWFDVNKLADLGNTVLDIKNKDVENHVAQSGFGLSWLLWNQKGVDSLKGLFPKDDEEEDETITQDDAITKEDLEEADSVIESQYDAAMSLLKTINENSEYYVSSLVHGLIFTASAIAMDGTNSPVYRTVINGELGTYQNLIETCSSISASVDEVNVYQANFTRFIQYVNQYFGNDTKNKNERNALINYNYNTKAQKAYLAAANDPSVYLLHSYYDMVMNDKRGTMARAFPTYYMLLVDEGRSVGLWRLQDNFYNMNSIVEFDVVRSRKIAADTARIVMTNMYGVFTSEDEDQKDENQYTFKDVWNSIFSPRIYFQKEYARRKNAREINRAKMQPGARVHLRAGYGSDAGTLPILFNGTVAEFEAGEVMTLVCQGDGVELSNPHMFNAIDANDVQDIEHNEDFFLWKSIMQKCNSRSTPRDLLVLPLAAHGTFIQEAVKKWSNGRLFSSNMFGVTHFGDKRYNVIFPTNGEVEQNIYECLNKPAWNWKKSGQGEYMKEVVNGLNDSYALDEAPKVRVPLNNGFSYWDLMGIASSLSPEFIASVAPFQLRSTVFYGAPHYYYAYDYEKVDGKVLEKRKPFQQSHIITSYSDIIDNKMTTSTRFSTNAVGHYKGPGWMSTTSKTVGPLWADIDIFPENQKSTTVNLNFEYRTNDLFNIPIISNTQETFDWTEGPNGKKTAWRSTASYLKESVKDMYGGEIIIMGNPAIKPYDRLRIADIYEDISGTVEVEQVVHMFSSENGYVTAVTPDLISAVDNKYETLDNAVASQALIPAVVANGFNIYFGISFNATHRPLYLSIARAFSKGGDIAATAFGNAATFLGKEAMQRDSGLIGKYLSEGMKATLSITNEDILLDEIVRSISKIGTSFNMPSAMGGPTYLKMVDTILDIDNILAAADNVDGLDDLLKNHYKLKDVADDVAKLSLSTKAASIKSLAKLDIDTIGDMAKAVNAITDKSDDIVKLSASLDDIVKAGKSVNLTEGTGKELAKLMKKAISTTDDFTKSGLENVVKPLSSMMDEMADAAKVFSTIDDITDTARTVKHAIKGLKGIASAALPALLLMAVEAVLSKSVKNWITGELKNWQVLTMYPVFKENKVWTAGIEGHSGSVYGSLTYDTPGWLEQCAINFFDYGNNASGGSFEWWMALMRDMFITTSEMKQVVDEFKRSNTGVAVDSLPASEEKAITEAKNYLEEKIVLSQYRANSDYQNMFLTSRISLEDIKNKTEKAAYTCAKYRFYDVDNIETTRDISSQLIFVPSSCDIITKMYENGTFKILESKTTTTDPVSGKTVEVVPKLIMDDNGTGSRMVYVKQVTEPENVYKVYDIPYLRPDACKLLNYAVEKILDDLQPDYQSPYCNFEEMEKHPIILHSATRVNGREGWRSTGFLFTIEVKNYRNFSNIVNEMLEEQKHIVDGANIKTTCFATKKETDSAFGEYAYTFFMQCPEE